ncbi:MAG: hypothetical protein LBP73_11735 [Clostridiales Family XIII bacterium]|jgi:hypothetical protein|nr:hypothetical protein [Clostridiales Family XIII bacterium]
MSGTQYFYLAKKEENPEADAAREEARSRFLRMRSGDIGGIVWGGASWYRKPFRDEGLIRHKADKLIFFIGSDPKDAENLHATFKLRIENDLLTLTHTCVVFIPAGVAHGELSADRVDKPVLCCSSLIGTGDCGEEAAEATAPAGTYAGQAVERYEPTDGKLPGAPEGFLTLLLWLDGRKLPGAPYVEAVWFNQTNDTGPAPHEHEFDEFIGFIGSDPAHPEELNAEVQFHIGGDAVTVTKSCLVYIPRGVRHSPILVPRMERPIIHFSGGVGGDYKRVGSESDTNAFRLG